ncbi:MAG: hypothetical protein Q8S42_26580 [Archangium sp.]|nr:hypothetical protein [Archangium sp.]
MTIRKVEPQASAPRPVAKPSTPVAPRPSLPAAAPTVSAEVKANINVKTGRTSSFEAFKPAPIALEKPQHSRSHHTRDPDAPSEGRGTNDDSVGRGTNDDSIGRGTNDDSIGRGTNDDSIGRGTNDDSIGRGTNDDSIGGGPHGPRGTGDGAVGAEEVTNQGAALIPGQAGLSPETVKQMEELATGRSDRAQNAAYVFSTPEFQAMPVEQRSQIVGVMNAGGREVTLGMAEMFEQSGGDMLTQKGNGGVTVLDSLVRMTEHGEGMVGDVMYDLVNPGRIWQGRAPTCTVSSMQYELAHEDPAEYARLMAGLVCDGKVTMRGGGELVVDIEWARRASSVAGDGRSGSEAVFQAAAMEFANGSDLYLEYSQQSVGSGESYRGLKADQIRNMVGELFGVEYETREIGSDAEATAELNQILERERPNRPVLFDIMIDGSQSNHCVSLESVKNGRVYYRDPTTGERESMSVEEFRTSLVAVHYAPESQGFFGSMAGRFKNLFI